MTRYFIFLVFLLYLGSIKVNAQDIVLVTNEEFRPVAQEALDSLYNRNTEAAAEIFKPWREKYPEHPVWSLWDGMELWWVVLEDLDNQSHDEEFHEKMKKADFRAGRFLQNNNGHPDGLIVRAAANGYVARHKSNREEWMSSLNHGRLAYQSQQAMQKVLPNFADNLIAEGIIKYYAAYLPDAYPFMKTMTWFLPSGDREEGLRLLEKAVNESLFAGPEALYFLGIIRLNYEQDFDGAVKDFQRLVNRYPNNSYYRRLFVRSLFQMRKYDKADEEIEKAVQHWENNNYPLMALMKEELMYWKGRIFLKKNNLQQAFTAFADAFEYGEKLANSKERTYRTLSGFYAGYSAEKLNNMEKAAAYYEAVVSMNGDNEVKKRAKSQLSSLDQELQ